MYAITKGWLGKVAGLWLGMSMVLISLGAGAQTVPAGSTSGNSPQAPVTSQGEVSDGSKLAMETTQLKTALKNLDTKYYVPMTDGSQAMWRQWARAEWSQGHGVITRPQMVVVVNRNPKVQRIAIMVAYPDQPWDLLWVSKVSTGQSARFDHYITPTGVFDYNGTVLGYRALGTKNKNGIRGLGKAGSRVWDFGWQQAETGWLKKPEERSIRMMLHATDPEYIEPRLGKPASKGCIHVSDGMNKFLDQYGGLDLAVDAKLATSRAWRALVPKGATPMLPGQYLIIVADPLPEGMAPTQVGPTRSEHRRSKADQRVAKQGTAAGNGESRAK